MKDYCQKYPNARFKTKKEFQKWFCNEFQCLIPYVYRDYGRVVYSACRDIFHNFDDPCIIDFNGALYWRIGDENIEEFHGLWLEDLNEAQLKKLEFYKLKHNNEE